MALQDLTPQLRTRLGRVERAVAIFVIVATLLLLAGFAYYVHHTAQRKGWFLTKAPYFTYVESAAGLKVGDPVKMMGFDVGEITRITAEDPGKEYDVFIEFAIKSPYYGYLWTDSRARVTATDFLGNRYLEVTKGGTSGRTNDLHATFQEKGGKLTAMWGDKTGAYEPFTNGSKYWLFADESPALTERLESLAKQVEQALPGIFHLTNQLAAVLTNGTRAVNSADKILTEIRPVIADAQAVVSGLKPVADNITAITTRLREPKGSLGEWLIPTNLNQQLEQTLSAAGGTLGAASNTLTTANTTIANADTNLTLLLSNLNRSLDSLAGITSNLNSQVQSNTNILGEVSAAVVHADDLVQGLKRHWLLRSAFKKTNAPPAPTGKR